MLDASQLKCPVCRAQQKRQSQCRRCGADLALYVKTLHSAEIAREQRLQARRSGETLLVANISRYLNWLNPREEQME